MALPQQADARPSWIGDCWTWLIRPRRVLLVLSVVWVLNAFDLCYTLLEANGRHFRELNPIAVHLLKHPELLIAYKSLLVVVGSTILLLCRTRRVAEMGCWLLLAAYAYVLIRWSLYYNEMLIILNDPAVEIAPILSCAP